MARSSSNSTCASDLQSSVFPTPVGPQNKNEPMGRWGSCKPLRLRRTALATAVTASFWPTTRWCRRSSRTNNLGALRLHHAAHGHAGPCTNHFGRFRPAQLLGEAGGAGPRVDLESSPGAVRCLRVAARAASSRYPTRRVTDRVLRRSALRQTVFPLSALGQLLVACGWIVEAFRAPGAHRLRQAFHFPTVRADRLAPV